MSADFSLLAKLSEQLAYDPETGVFTWVVSKRKVKAGSIAGSRGPGYVTIFFEGKKYYAHRLAWLFTHGEFPPQLIDHINGDQRDNRISNLRAATVSQNKRNSKVQRSSKSGVKGVWWCARIKKWQAQATYLGRKNNLGYYCTAEEAQQAYIAFVNRVEPGFCRV
jgi:hypothetical protein